MRLSATRVAAIAQSRGLGNPLWDLAGELPSLDQRFAEDKSLVDAISGQNLITFSRASGATYVDSQGVIRNAVTNLLLRSEEFDNASWALLLSAALSANQTVAPNGTLSADRLTISNSSAFSGIRQNCTFLASTAYTFSVWVRAVTGTASFRLKVYDGTADTFSANQSATETWQRYTLTMTTAAGAGAGNIAIANIVSPLNQQNIYIWGAQLERSSTVGEYAPTGATINSAPRFDHDPITGESLGLLVEEQRTNLLLRSEEFDDAYWPKTRCSVNANVAIAPNGSTTADKLVEDGTASATHRLDSSSVAFSAGLSALSLFAKADERTRIQISWDGTISGTASSTSCSFNLITATTGTPFSVGNISSPVASIASQGDGWYRISLSASASAAFTGVVRINLLDASGNTSYSGDNTSGLFLWGAQLEGGFGPTSYIPTEGTAVTRAADVASISGSNFSSWYRQDEGTVFAEAIPSATTGNGIVGFDDGTSTERWRIGHTGITAGGAVIVDGTVQANLQTAAGSWPLGVSGKIAGAIQLNNSAVSANGLAAVEDLSCTVPAVTQMTIGTASATAYANARIRRLVFWPQRLGNEVLQRITQ